MRHGDVRLFSALVMSHADDRATQSQVSECNVQCRASHLAPELEVGESRWQVDRGLCAMDAHTPLGINWSFSSWMPSQTDETCCLASNLYTWTASARENFKDEFDVKLISSTPVSSHGTQENATRIETQLTCIPLHTLRQ